MIPISNLPNVKQAYRLSSKLPCGFFGNPNASEVINSEANTWFAWAIVGSSDIAVIAVLTAEFSYAMMLLFAGVEVVFVKPKSRIGSLTNRLVPVTSYNVPCAVLYKKWPDSFARVAANAGILNEVLAKVSPGKLVLLICTNLFAGLERINPVVFENAT